MFYEDKREFIDAAARSLFVSHGCICYDQTREAP